MRARAAFRLLVGTATAALLLAAAALLLAAAALLESVGTHAVGMAGIVFSRENTKRDCIYTHVPPYTPTPPTQHPKSRKAQADPQSWLATNALWSWLASCLRHAWLNIPAYTAQ